MLRLKPVSLSDWAALYAWRNDPKTREAFVQQEPVGINEHLRWLTAAMKDDRNHIYIAIDDQLANLEVGTGRLQIDDGTAAISITIAAECRGRGYAAPLIEALVKEAAALGADKVEAQVRENNFASLRAFSSSGFELEVAGGEVVTVSGLVTLFRRLWSRCEHENDND